MKLNLIVDNCQDTFEITEELSQLVENAITAAIEYEAVDFDCSVSLTYTDNAGIREINNEYRGKDTATDVLSFPMFDTDTEEIYALDGAPAVLGDIVISLERAFSQAEEFGHSFEREVAFLCVHSVLHLLGYDHELSEEDDKIMRQKQRDIMRVLGLEIK